MQQAITKTCARIPTADGEFSLCLYSTPLDDKEHLALVVGEIESLADGAPLVRIHSECFTGDVLGSLRCDCGPQLAEAMRRIAKAGSGVILYLRQEGRGIGLKSKLQAYNLIDAGYDTVDANVLLGHEPDERDYSVAALILRDLGVTELRLLTNNPAKIEGLEAAGLSVIEREPLQIPSHPENADYLATKVKRMRHLLNLEGEANGRSSHVASTLPLKPEPRVGRPFVTLSYAQSIDGSITIQRGQPTALSGDASMKLTHQLRASHDAILVGIETVLADNPRLNVRLVSGSDPQPVILDSRLRFPPDAKLMARQPWIVTTEKADAARQAALEKAGAAVWRLPATAQGLVSLPALMTKLAEAGTRSLMVEGGAQVITSFLASSFVDRVMVTVAPRYLGGLTAVGAHNGRSFAKLHNILYEQVGDDLVLLADVERV